MNLDLQNAAQYLRMQLPEHAIEVTHRYSLSPSDSKPAEEYGIIATPKGGTGQQVAIFHKPSLQAAMDALLAGFNPETRAATLRQEIAERQARLRELEGK